MHIYVDADACPVKEIIVRIARQYALPVTMVLDTSHLFQDGYSTVITVEQGKDSADLKLINLVQKGDAVITQDYGVAAMALGKGASALHPGGLIYSSGNMDRLLFERHLGQKVRRAGGRTAAMKKRSKEDDLSFEKSFLEILQAAGVR